MTTPARLNDGSTVSHGLGWFMDTFNGHRFGAHWGSTVTGHSAVIRRYDEGLTVKALEAHYLAGGNVPLIIRSMIAARKAKIIELSYKRATAIDLAGRNILEAVQTSVYPRVIDCPPKNSKRPSLDAIAKNGIQLKVKARVTVRANLDQLVGGATEETIVARVGEGIVSAIGSSETHADVLENPDRISKAVLARRLDSQTAFEIVSIDIADIDVGDNIGARLQADQAEADTRVARAKAEQRRAMAVAQEQERHLEHRFGRAFGGVIAVHRNQLAFEIQLRLDAAAGRDDALEEAALG